MITSPSRRGLALGLRLCAVSMLALALAGCVVGPNYQAPGLKLPTHWNADKNKKNAEKPQLTEWWRQMNDPLLDHMVEHAVASNLDVASAKARIREARATYRQTTGALYPTVSGSSSATRSKATSSGETTIANSIQGGFDASWEIDLFGANRRASEAALYSAQAADEDLRDTLVTLIGDVTSYYVQAREYQALIALASRTARSQNSTASLTRAKLEAGNATGLDTATADAQAASTQADVPTYRISYAESVNRLAVLLASPASQIEAQLKDKPGKIPSPKLVAKVGIPADVLNSRPDIRLAERQLAQYTAKIGAAEAARYPSISLTGNIATSAANLADLGNKSTISWSLGPSVSVPIFQGGQLKAAVDVAKAQRDQYYIAYQSSVLSAMEDVENAVVALTQSRDRRAKLATSVAHYRKAAELSQSLNQEGSTDLLDVLETQRSLYSAESNLIQSQASIATYYIALHKALGGGWSGALDVETPEAVDLVTHPRIASH